MAYHDISLNLSEETARWINSAPYELTERRRTSKGDSANTSAVNMSVHAGTHLDAPFHFIDGGVTIDEMPVEAFIGPTLVCQVDADKYITREHVEAIPLQGDTKVLFKTRNSKLLHEAEYVADFAAFSVEAAEALVSRGVRLVGLDYCLSGFQADGHGLRIFSSCENRSGWLRRRQFYPDLGFGRDTDPGVRNCGCAQRASACLVWRRIVPSFARFMQARLGCPALGPLDSRRSECLARARSV